MTEMNLKLLHRISENLDKLYERALYLEEFLYIKDKNGKTIADVANFHDILFASKIVEDLFPAFVENIEKQAEERFEQEGYKSSYYDSYVEKIYEYFDRRLFDKLLKPEKDLNEFDLEDISNYLENVLNFIEKSGMVSQKILNRSRKIRSEFEDFKKGTHRAQKLLNRIALEISRMKKMKKMKKR
jgi:hypothetical protein